MSSIDEVAGTLRKWSAHGRTCLIRHAPLYGAINGYVKADLSEAQAEAVEVHGGVTYNRDGWVGFDTLHLGDYWPEQYKDRGVPVREPRDHDRLWDQASVAAETERLAVECNRVLSEDAA